MFCTNCGKQLPDGSKFCSDCGTVQPTETAVPEKEPAKASAPENNASAVFAENFSTAQPTIQPKKKKKFSAKLKGLLVSVLVFLVVFAVRYAVRNGIEGIFSFLDNSIQAAQEKTYEELDTLMSDLDVVVTGYSRDRWEEDNKTGPLLTVLMENKTGKTITSCKIAIATWYESGVQTKLVLDDGEHNDSNITYLTLEGCNWLPGTIYKEKGLALSSSSPIPERIQAIAMNWTYSDGETVANPHIDDWLYKYEDKSNERSDLSETQFPQDLVMSEADLLAALLTQPLVTTNYETSQWSDGDLLCATISNNSSATIKCVYVAYATWDEEGNPVCVTTGNNKQMTSNIVKISLGSDLSIAPGQTCGEETGAALHKDSPKVAKFSAIAYYYEDTEGNTWENPYYWAWLNLYEKN